MYIYFIVQKEVEELQKEADEKKLHVDQLKGANSGKSYLKILFSKTFIYSAFLKCPCRKIFFVSFLV